MKTPRHPTSTPLALILALMLAALTASGCSGGPAQGSPPDLGDRPAFCARTGDDIVRTAFCEGPDPGVASLSDLKALLKVSDDPYGGLTAAFGPVFLGHSTALSGRFVSPINPRVIFPGGGGSLLA